MSTPTVTIPAQPHPETLDLLHLAIAALRASPNDIIMSPVFQHTHDVADHLERLTTRLIAGDTAAGRELYMAFVATSDWDDACGSQQLGNQLCEALRLYCPVAR